MSAYLFYHIYLNWFGREVYRTSSEGEEQSYVFLNNNRVGGFILREKFAGIVNHIIVMKPHYSRKQLWELNSNLIRRLS